MAANRAGDDEPWVVTCDLTENHFEIFTGELTEEQLGEALREKGWVLPVYGGTFCGPHYAAMKRLGERIAGDNR